MQLADVKEYGAVGDGVTNDTGAFITALNANRTVHVSNGKYVVDNVILNQTRKIFSLEDAVILRNGATPTFEFKGGHVYMGAVLSSASVETLALSDDPAYTGKSVVTKITLNVPVTVNKGDFIKIVSEDTPMWGVGVQFGNMTMKCAEVLTIAVSAVDSFDVYVVGTLRYTYLTNVRLYRPNRERLILEGLNFEDSPTVPVSGVEMGVVTLRGGFGSNLKNVRFLNRKGRGVSNYGYFTQISDIYCENQGNKPNQNNYGYGIEDGGFGLTANNLIGRNLRHLYSGSARATDPNSNDIEYYGSGCNAVVALGIGKACQGQTFDTHECNYNVKFSKCIAEDNFEGASSGGLGFSLRGVNITAEDCDAINCKLGFGVSTYRGARLKNCRSLGTHLTGLQIGKPPQAGGYTDMKDIEIDGCTFEGGLRAEEHNNALVTVATIGQANFATEAKIKNSTFILKGKSTNSSRVWQVENAKIEQENNVMDISGWNSFSYVRPIHVRDNNTSIKGDRLKVIGGASVASSKVLLFEANVANCTADLEITNFSYQHDTAWPNINSNGFKPKLSYTITNSSEPLNNRIRSSKMIEISEWELLNTYGGVLPIDTILDEIISVRIYQGTANINLGTIPARLGRVLIVNNDRDVAISASLPPISIPARATWMLRSGTQYYKVLSQN